MCIINSSNILFIHELIHSICWIPSPHYLITCPRSKNSSLLSYAALLLSIAATLMIYLRCALHKLCCSLTELRHTFQLSHTTPLLKKIKKIKYVYFTQTWYGVMRNGIVHPNDTVRYPGTLCAERVKTRVPRYLFKVCQTKGSFAGRPLNTF